LAQKADAAMRPAKQMRDGDAYPYQACLKPESSAAEAG